MSERSYSERAQFAVAARADCPPELLTRIAESKFPRTRARVAGNPRTTAATLRKLAGDTDHAVLEAVAENPNSGRAALKKLFNGSGSVYSNVAHRRLHEPRS